MEDCNKKAVLYGFVRSFYLSSVQAELSPVAYGATPLGRQNTVHPQEPPRASPLAPQMSLRPVSQKWDFCEKVVPNELRKTQIICNRFYFDKLKGAEKTEMFLKTVSIDTDRVIICNYR